MNNTTKVRLGFCLSVCAFILTITLSQSAGFYEMNPILRFIFESFNNYQVIVIYAFMWGAIFTIYSYAENKINKYQTQYIANIILLVGFFDLLHDVVIVLSKL